MKRVGVRGGSGGGACRSIARFSVNPRCGARRAVYRPENYHQAKAHPRPHEPPPESRFKQNAAQRQMGRIAPRDVPRADVVSEDEQTGNSCEGRKPGAEALPECESCPE